MSDEEDMAGQACPVDHKTREAWLQKSQMAQSSPTVISRASSHSTEKYFYHPESGRIRLPPKSSTSRSSSNTQPRTLSTHREISSIPRALPSDSPDLPQPSSATSTTAPSASHSYASQVEPTTPSTTSRPANNESESGTSPDGRWVYPSEQQFFNAMLRKKHAAQPQDMRSIVPIHNAVNERAWNEILRWESSAQQSSSSSASCGGPKLASFSGLSTKLTPRARWNSWVLGYQAPFDRHDWIVDRCGTRVDYVIDFYEGKDERRDGKPLNFYLDVRPKLNTVEGCRMRIRHALGI